MSEVNLLSHVQLFATSWTVAHQAPPSMEFSRQEYWSGFPFPSLTHGGEGLIHSMRLGTVLGCSLMEARLEISFEMRNKTF